VDQIAIARFQPRLEEPEFAFHPLENLMFMVDLPSIKGTLLLLHSLSPRAWRLRRIRSDEHV